MEVKVDEDEATWLRCVETVEARRKAKAEANEAKKKGGAKVATKAEVVEIESSEDEDSAKVCPPPFISISTCRDREHLARLRMVMEARRKNSAADKKGERVRKKAEKEADKVKKIEQAAEDKARKKLAAAEARKKVALAKKLEKAAVREEEKGLRR